MRYKFHYTALSFFFLFALVMQSCTPKASKEMQAGSVPHTGIEQNDQWRAKAPEPGPAPAFNLGDYEEFALDNGLKVIVVENHKLPVVSYQLFVDRGPTREGDLAGVSSIAGQMLRTGTENKSKAEIDEELDFIAATLNTTSNGFYASSLKRHSDELLDIATDVLYNPSFPESEFDRIIQTTKSGLAFQKSDPNSIAQNVGNAVMYGREHPYGEFTTEESIAAITLEDVKDFYKNYYFPNEAYLIIVGDVNAAEAKDQARKHFGSWQEKSDFVRMIPSFVEAPAKNNVSFVNRDGAVQSVISVSQPVDYKPNAEDRMAASVMNTILGGYFGSRLNKNIREDKGYTYGIRSSLSPDLYVGGFSISASVRNEVTDSTLTEILKEIQGLRDIEIPKQELELVKNVLTGQFARGLEQPQTVAQYALNIARYNLPKDYYKTYLTRLNAITPAEIETAAKKYLQPDRYQIFVVGNESEVAEKLLPFDQDSQIDFYDIKANKVDRSLAEENEEIEGAAVTAQSVIERYLDALGGRKKVEGVHSYIVTSKAETPMGDITTTIKSKDNQKLHMKVESSGMVVQEITFNGMKAKIGGVQGSQVISDPKEFDRFKALAAFAEELDYFISGNYQVSYIGKETMEGTPAYKILVKQADGTNKTEYYSVDSGLKLKEVINVEANGQQITTTQELGEYKEVDGIMYPMEITMTGGGMPFEMVTKVEKVEFNPDIPDSDFNIEE